MSAAGAGSPSYTAALTADDLLSAFDNAPIGMALVTPVGVITACNAAMGDLLLRSPQDLVGGTFFDVTHPDDLESARANCALMQDGRTHILRHECRFVRADHEVVWVSVSTSRVSEQRDRPAHLIMHIEDVTERKDLEAELHRHALHDPLTGLANRRLLIGHLEDALRSAGRHTRPGQLFYLDLDGFKDVNDEHGHAAGDEVLRELARRLTALLGPDDTAARLGGDEFVVLRTDAHPDRSERFAADLAAAAAGPFTIGDVTVVLGAAIGHVEIEPTSAPADADRYLREADRRMYASKKRRRHPSR
jgi:diguanylate cyclase (GGDEF)-like protein/PAS domain S-box-containing protein